MNNEVAIVSTARTPIGKAYRGAFNNLPAQKLAALALNKAIERAGITSDLIEDVTLGCALTQGSAAANLARHAAIAANLPVTVAGQTIDRQCASGLSAMAIAAGQLRNGEANIVMAGGVDSITCVQNENWNGYLYRQKDIADEFYMSMLETAENVAKKYAVSRSDQDAYALQSQQRTAAAQQTGIFTDEVFACDTIKLVKNKETGEVTEQAVHLQGDECNRPNTELSGLANLQPVLGDNTSITAGNASQLSDGACASVMMRVATAQQMGLQPLGIMRGMAVAGCAPEEMGIGPIVAIPKLLKQHGLSIADIDLWEINEAFASQLLACQQVLDIPMDKLNVNGGAIAIGHPYGMSGARMAGHILLEGQRRNAKWGVVSMCVGGGQGAAALFEIYSA